MTRFAAAGALAVLVTISHYATAQEASVGTSSGVYTAAQATKGEETYMNVCVACHPAGTYATAAFREKWDGKPLAELFTQVAENMPKQEPASLTPEEYTQLVAYLLKINDAPSGKDELPADAAALKKFKIEMPKRE